ncbi:uncharacterized protein TNCV_3004501 [Trichonephila clavipes]|nr:uncharacterized protein TNCV_3004501 [Trichonephila clavipes]
MKILLKSSAHLFNYFSLYHPYFSKNASPSIPSVSTSSYTTQTNILPSASLSSIKPTTQIESRLPGPISTSAAAPDNSLNTSTSSTETCPAPTTSNKFAALQLSESLLESATSSNSELSKTSKVPQNVKMNEKNRRKSTKSRNINKNG